MTATETSAGAPLESQGKGLPGGLLHLPLTTVQIGHVISDSETNVALTILVSASSNLHLRSAEFINGPPSTRSVTGFSSTSSPVYNTCAADDSIFVSTTKTGS